MDFNPHTREGCDTKNQALFRSPINFNPHTREGCDVGARVHSILRAISIHTPARGVTRDGQPCSLDRCKISIHTPARGVTADDNGSESEHYDFNPHTREGCDGGVRFHWRKEPISIHTPARGVTTIPCLRGTAEIISIHTPARGVTAPHLRASRSSTISIHTPARGVTSCSCL